MQFISLSGKSVWGKGGSVFYHPCTTAEHGTTPRLPVNNHDRVAHCRKSLAMVKEILQPLKPEVCAINGKDFC
jgi:hypothetical protein